MSWHRKEISALMGIGRGVTALMGAGGKTTLLYTLAEELRGRGSVLLCTSTHIRRPGEYPLVTDGDPERLRAALARYGAVCAGTPAPEGKLTAPALSFDTLAALADYVLVEADGARGRPLKAHAPHEPVIPPNAGRVILVAGMDGLGRPLREVCHRPERFAALAGASLGEPVTAEHCVRVLEAEDLGDIVYLNKTEDAGRRAAAERLAAGLSRPVLAGSLHRREYICLH